MLRINCLRKASQCKKEKREKARLIFHSFYTPFTCLNRIHYITIRIWRGFEGCCYPTESSGFSLRPATSGPIWIQSDSTGGSQTQVNINPPPTLSISPITINHYSLQPGLMTASACQLLSVTGPFSTVWSVSLLKETEKAQFIYPSIYKHNGRKEAFSFCIRCFFLWCCMELCLCRISQWIVRKMQNKKPQKTLFKHSTPIYLMKNIL